MQATAAGRTRTVSTAPTLDPETTDSLLVLEAMKRSWRQRRKRKRRVMLHVNRCPYVLCCPFLQQLQLLLQARLSAVSALPTAHL